MKEKLSECCGKEDPEFGVCFLPKGHIGSHQYSPCTIASKPSRKELAQEAERTGHIPTDLDVLPMDADDEPTSKPDASPDRLLTIQETLVAVNRYPRNPAEGTHTLSDREVTFCRTVSQAQDAKTYPLAFEAGKKEQAEKDRQEIETLESGIDDLAKTAQKRYQEGKKQGAKELAKWLYERSTAAEVDFPPKLISFAMTYKLWQAKLKELEER